MLSIAYYILKVIICSGILYGYYRIALHNKIFHRWNRFFLLGAVITSLSFPLIRINILHNPADDGQIIKLLNVVTTGDEYVHEVSRSGSFHISGEQIAMAAYIIISLALLVVLLHSLIRLSRMARHNPLQKIHHIHLVQTEAKGTPFSFFRYIFWNRNIDLYSDAGNKIFRHEMVHVTEKHSADKLFMHIVLIFFWCNPFFWLIRREMNMIHEFIADSKAIEDNDTAAFAAMVLQAAYPQQTFGLTSSFFSSPIKRRLHMLTQIQHPRISYISRVLALPLLAFVFAAFSIKTRQPLPGSSQGITKLMKPVTVVIDAGHGGDDGGAISPDGIKEKDITLSIVKKVAELNNNKNIRIVLTRQSDVLQPVREKVTLALQQKPDAFISLHINAAPAGMESRSGFEILLSRHTTAYSRQSQLLGSILATEIEKTYGTAPVLTQRGEKGVWVLDAPAISYPALLLSCGYLTSKSDLAFITNKASQEKIARDILAAIERFAKAKDEEIVILPKESDPVLPASSSTNSKNGLNASPHTTIPMPAKKQGSTDTLPPNIKSVDITKDNQVIIIYRDNKAEKITKAEAQKRGLVLAPDRQTIELRNTVPDSVLYFIDGAEAFRSDVQKLAPNEIESIHVIRDKTATDKYGKRAENGVIEIVLKKISPAAGDKIFQEAEKAPEFPGGKAAWTKYISGAINRVIDSLQKENKSGTCVVQFIVDTKGNLSEVKPLTMEGTLLSKTVVDALKNGPKWIPAMQNGHVVKAYHKQPVTFRIAEEK